MKINKNKALLILLHFCLGVGEIEQNIVHCIGCISVLVLVLRCLDSLVCLHVFFSIGPVAPWLQSGRCINSCQWPRVGGFVSGCGDGGLACVSSHALHTEARRQGRCHGTV